MIEFDQIGAQPTAAQNLIAQRSFELAQRDDRVAQEQRTELHSIRIVSDFCVG